MLSITLALIKNEGLEEELDVELDECINYLVRDELTDISEVLLPALSSRV